MTQHSSYSVRLLMAGLVSAGLLTACSGHGFRPSLAKDKLSKLAKTVGKGEEQTVANNSSDAKSTESVADLRENDSAAIKDLQVIYQEMAEQTKGVSLLDLESASGKVNLNAAEVVLGLSVSKLAVAVDGSQGLHIKSLINLGDSSATSVFFDGQVQLEKDGKSTPTKLNLVFENSNKKLKETDKVSAFAACKGENCANLMILVSVEKNDGKSITAGYRFKSVEDKFVYDGGSVGALFKSFEEVESAVFREESKDNKKAQKDEPMVATQVGGGAQQVQTVKTEDSTKQQTTVQQQETAKQQEVVKPVEQKQLGGAAEVRRIDIAIEEKKAAEQKAVEQKETKTDKKIVESKVAVTAQKTAGAVASVKVEEKKTTDVKATQAKTQTEQIKEAASKLVKKGGEYYDLAVEKTADLFEKIDNYFTKKEVKGK